MTKKVDFERIPDRVFVSVTPPASVQQQFQSKNYFHDWTAATSEMADPSPNDAPTTPPETSPTPEALLASHLPHHIETTRWGRYITPGPASRILNNTIFVYHDPSPNFWDLYELSKGIFRDLGIRLSKQGGAWVAHIPIGVLTDKVFIESGLAGVEKTLLHHTGIDPGAVLAGIRCRQFERTHRGMAKVKAMREWLADAVGLIAIVAVSWAAYVVMGGVA